MADSTPAHDAYLMSIAQSVAAGGDCSFLKVGAVIAKGDAVLSVGHLGTPEGVAPCAEGGCPGCASGQPLSPLCTCIHAESAAVLAAARHGVALEGGTCYGTHKPCLECLKQLMQAGITRVVFLTARPRDAEYLRVYGELVQAHGIQVEQLAG